tara:strand:+ start:796 stop:1116 length:321 start_codon:yes stop_codon:yes gene_type:complete
MSKKGENRGDNGQFKKGHSIGQSTQFKKGEVSNPNGRRGALADIINKVFDEIEVDNKTKKERMIRKVYRMAMNGSLGAVNYLSDRTEGKAKEYVETKVVKDEVVVV